jgi:hypothetical protein
VGPPGESAVRAGGPDHAGASAKEHYASGYRVTGDSNAPKAAEFLCAVADESFDQRERKSFIALARRRD